MTDEINLKKRERCKRNDFSWMKPYHSLKCHFGVWDMGFRFDPENKYEVICKMNRKDFCFFLEYRKGMLLPAAERVQERQAAYHEAARDRRLTIWGLWIAGFALLVNVGFEIYKWVFQ
ncbi:MAG: hypothetical protein ACE5D1_02170 [Fidelibacterota bacterium]